MNKVWRNRLIFVAAATLLVGALAYLLRDFSREMIVRYLARYVWVLNLVFLSIPRPLLWTLFILSLLVITFRSLAAEEPRARPTVAQDHLPPAVGPVAAEMHWVQLARAGHYGRWRLAQRLADLAAEAMAYQQGLSPNDVKQLLRRGEIALPTELLLYVRGGLGSVISPPVRFARWRRGGPASALDAEHAADLVRYLEEELEAKYDG